MAPPRVASESSMRECVAQASADGSQPITRADYNLIFSQVVFLGEVIAAQFASQRSGNYAVLQVDRRLSDPHRDWRLSVLVPGLRFCAIQQKRFVGAVWSPGYAVPLLVFIRNQP